MKKTISILLIVLLSILSFADIGLAYHSSLRVESLGFYQSIEGMDTVVTEIPAGSVFTKAKVINRTLDEQHIALVAAVYRDNYLADIRIVNAVLQPAEVIEFSTSQDSFLIPDEHSGYSLKGFLLKDFESLIPVSSPVVIQDATAADTLFDNFSGIDVSQRQLLQAPIDGAKFCAVSNLAVYSIEERQPLGYEIFEATNGRVMEGNWERQCTASITYHGNFGGQRTRIALSANDSKYCDAFFREYGDTDTIEWGQWSLLQKYYFAEHLKIYAGPSEDALSPIEITGWEGAGVVGATLIAAISKELPPDTKYVKFEITEMFDWNFRILSVKIDTSRNMDHYNYVNKPAVKFDNFGSITGITSPMLLQDTLTNGAEFCAAENLVYRPDKQPYGYVEYEGTANTVVEGMPSSSVASILYEGNFDGQVRVALSANDDRYREAFYAIYGQTASLSWGDWDVLRQYYFQNNLKIYAGYSKDSLECLEITNWSGLGVLGGTILTASTEAIPAGAKYILVEITDFSQEFRLLSVRMGLSTVQPTKQPSATPSPVEGDYSWVDTSKYDEKNISVVYPAYTSDIYENQQIYIYAPNFRTVTVKCRDKYKDTVVATVTTDSEGFGTFLFPASEYPKGPVTLRLIGESLDDRDLCTLQLYNHNGAENHMAGLALWDTPLQVESRGLKLAFADDFDKPDLSISRKGYPNNTYYSGQPNQGSFSAIKFRDFEDTMHNPFSQIDTYLRIRADAGLNSAGLISSVNNQYEGFSTMLPCYFECRFIAPYAEGTWPAFWVLNRPKDGIGDELDVIEAYGFDDPTFNGTDVYIITNHVWGGIGEEFQERVDMTKLGNGSWYTNFHTYGVMVDDDYTTYYCDNIEVHKHPTTNSSKIEPLYFLINLAVGGNGWSYDLTRYNGVADMYVDWVRVYNLEGK